MNELGFENIDVAVSSIPSVSHEFFIFILSIFTLSRTLSLDIQARIYIESFFFFFSFRSKEIPRGRFADPVSDSCVQGVAKNSIPKNTQRRNMWALRTFNEWAMARNNTRVESSTDEKVKITHSIETMSKEDLLYWLSKFVLEARKVDGHPYPPKTLLSLIMGLQSYVCFERQVQMNFLADKEFVGFRQVMDAEMKRLSSIGIGTNQKQAQAISTEQIDLLWKMKLLGDHSPRVLVRTMVFMNGKNFALRSGQEHRALRFNPPQITLHEPDGDTPYLLYVEDVSKSNQGGLKHMKVRRKEVKHYANTNNPVRCHVRLYKKYVSLCPPDMKKNAFYLQPLRKYEESSKVWFSKQPMGHNTLQLVVPELFKAAGIDGHYTNHSLRATAATSLYQHGVDEQLIMERTGHRSVEGESNFFLFKNTDLLHEG